MKILVLTATTLLALAASAVSPSSANARLGDKLDALKEERIMKTYGIEKAITAPVTQMRTYELWPQGKAMKDKTYIKLQFDAHERLLWAELWISEDYRKTEPVYTKHFAGLFLHSQLNLADTGSVRSLMTELQFREENPDVRLLGEVPTLPKEPSVAYKAVIAQTKKYETKLKKSRYSINTLKQKKQTWTRIRVE